MTERYDIRYNWDHERWDIIDTANRNCPTGEYYYERIPANQRADELNGRRPKQATR